MATYEELIKLCSKKFKLQWLYGKNQNGRNFLSDAQSSHYPSLYVGFLNIIHPERLHIIGAPEVAFLQGLSVPDRLGIVQQFRKNNSLGFVICKDLELPEDFVRAVIEENIPFFTSDACAEETLTNIRHNMVRLAAPSCSMHGVFMDVFGIGVLMTGQSGIGKSELGLELVTRGHGLVADDVVDFIQRGPNQIEGSAPALLANLLEVRGIGLLDVKTIFGETSVRRKMKLDLVAELKQFEQGELMDRLPETELYTEILGQQVRTMIIPVGGGRNLAVLVEAAVRSAILQKRGINTIQEFFNRQRELMEKED